MALTHFNRHPPLRQLRQFAAMLALIGAVTVGSALRHHAGIFTVRMTVGVPVLGLGLVGCAVPRIMRPVWVGWMVAAYPVSWAVSNAALASAYYLVATPLGAILRLVGHDPMQRRWDKSASTYWEPHDPADDKSRYFRQF